MNFYRETFHVALQAKAQEIVITATDDAARSAVFGPAQSHVKRNTI